MGEFKELPEVVDVTNPYFVPQIVEVFEIDVYFRNFKNFSKLKKSVVFNLITLDISVDGINWWTYGLMK